MIRSALAWIGAAPLAFMFACIAGPAAAQGTPCGSWAEIRAHLLDRFGERLAGTGLTPSGQLLAILVNPETGTWTALALQPDGSACGLTAGTDWADWAEPPGEPS